MLWWRETAMIQETPLAIHYVCITIEYGRQLCLIDFANNTAHSISGRQEITGIQETDIITIET